MNNAAGDNKRPLFSITRRMILFYDNSVGANFAVADLETIVRKDTLSSPGSVCVAQS